MADNDLSNAAVELGLTQSEWRKIRKACEFGQISILTRSAGVVQTAQNASLDSSRQDKTEATKENDPVHC